MVWGHLVPRGAWPRYCGAARAVEGPPHPPSSLPHPGPAGRGVASHAPSSTLLRGQPAGISMARIELNKTRLQTTRCAPSFPAFPIGGRSVLRKPLKTLGRRALPIYPQGSRCTLSGSCMQGTSNLALRSLSWDSAVGFGPAWARPAQGTQVYPGCPE